MFNAIVDIVTAEPSKLSPEESAKNNLDQAKAQYDQAQTNLRQFLGLPESTTPEQFQQAFKNMSLLVNARASSNRDPGQVNLVKTQLSTLTRALTDAGTNLSLAYKAGLNTPALITALVQDDAVVNPIDIQVTQAGAEKLTTPEAAAEAAVNTAVANATLKTTMLGAAKTEAELGKFNDVIEKALTAARIGSLSSDNLKNYSDALATLLTNKQAEIQTQLADAKAQIAQEVQTFQKAAAPAG